MAETLSSNEDENLQTPLENQPEQPLSDVELQEDIDNLRKIIVKRGAKNKLVELFREDIEGLMKIIDAQNLALHKGLKNDLILSRDEVAVLEGVRDKIVEDLKKEKDDKGKKKKRKIKIDGEDVEVEEKEFKEDKQIEKLSLVLDKVEGMLSNKDKYSDEGIKELEKIKTVLENSPDDFTEEMEREIKYIETEGVLYNVPLKLELPEDKQEEPLEETLVQKVHKMAEMAEKGDKDALAEARRNVIEAYNKQAKKDLNTEAKEMVKKEAEDQGDIAEKIPKAVWNKRKNEKARELVKDAIKEDWINRAIVRLKKQNPQKAHKIDGYYLLKNLDKIKLKTTEGDEKKLEENKAEIRKYLEDKYLLNLEELEAEPEIPQTLSADKGKKPSDDEGFRLSTLEEGEENERRELLDDIYYKGRLATHTVMTEGLTKERNVVSGYQTIIDQKFTSDNPADQFLKGKIREKGFLMPENIFGTTKIRELMEKNDINVAITIMPIIEQTPVYENRETKGFLGFGRKVEKVQVGTNEKPNTIDEFNWNIDVDPAYRIVYYVQGTDKKPYKDPTTGRSGGIFIGNIILPEDVAKDTFSQIQRNPSFAKQVLSQLDPRLMSEQQQYIPDKDAKVLIIPEGESAEVFKKDQIGRATQIKPEYIRWIV